MATRHHQDFEDGFDQDYDYDQEDRAQLRRNHGARDSKKDKASKNALRQRRRAKGDRDGHP